MILVAMFATPLDVLSLCRVGIVVLFFLYSGELLSQDSCADPETYTTSCTNGTGTCGQSGGNCNYQTTFQTQFNGNKRYCAIIIYADGVQVHSECVGPLSVGTTSYSVSYTAPCHAVISGQYTAYKSKNNPCAGTVCESGDCALGICSENVLPIVLESFSGIWQKSKVHLQWTTLSELNSEHFRVERSSDGDNWTAIATEEAAFETTKRREYQVIDHFPIVDGAFYRLISVDVDGSFTISQIIFVYSELEVHPIYFASDVKQIIASHHLEELLEIAIFDAQGRRVIIDFISPGGRLYLGDLSPGMYFLQVNYGEKVYSEKLVLS